MNMRQLQYFVALSESLSFTRAAERMGIAQPPFSMQIKMLEDELGVRLFDRSTRRDIRLSDAGRSLLPYAQRALNAVSAMKDVGHSLKEGGVGSLSISAGFSALLTIVPRIIQRLSDVRSRMDLRVHSLIGSEQLSAVLDGRIDVGIARGPISHPELTVSMLMSEEFIAAIPSTNQICGSASLTPQALAKQPIIATVAHPSDHSLREIGMSFFSGVGQVNVAFKVNQLSAALAMVRMGLGVALVPASLQEMKIENVVYRSLEGMIPETTLCLVKHRDTHGHMIDCLEAAARSSADETAARCKVGKITVPR